MTSDEDFLRRARSILTKSSKQGDASWDAHERTWLRPHLHLLRPAKLARSLDYTHEESSSLDGDLCEAWELDCDDASRLIESHDSPRMPLFVSDAQPFKWQDGARPIDLLWRRFPDMKRMANVRRASDPKHCSAKTFISLSDIRNRFAGNSGSGNPWKVLNMPSPLPDVVLPCFLHGPNASLLQDVKHHFRTSTQPSPTAFEQLAKLSDKLNWLSFCEGGAITTPQQDGCGVGTWITCQQGEIGFAWLSHPDPNHEQQWMSTPDDALEGARWRFKALRQRDTVYFGPGTPYFLITLPGHGKQVLAAGGHVRKSDVALWSATLLSQIQLVERRGDAFERSKPKLPPCMPFRDDTRLLCAMAVSLLDLAARLVEAAESELREEDFGGHVSVGAFRSNKVDIGEIIAEEVSAVATPAPASKSKSRKANPPLHDNPSPPKVQGGEENIDAAAVQSPTTRPAKRTIHKHSPAVDSEDAPDLQPTTAGRRAPRVTRNTEVNYRDLPPPKPAKNSRQRKAAPKESPFVEKATLKVTKHGGGGTKRARGSSESSQTVGPEDALGSGDEQYDTPSFKSIFTSKTKNRQKE